MTGERIYQLYCRAMSELPSHITRNEALPAWDFMHEELQEAWSFLGSHCSYVAPKRRKESE